MKDKDGLILESLYNKVVEEAKTKSKKQVGYLLSNKVSPLTAKQKKKLKKELHTGKVKVKNESSHAIGGSGTDSEIELDWLDIQDPDLVGHWYVYYDYDATGSHSSGSYDEPPSSDIEIEVEYVKIIKFNDQDQTEEVVYDGSPYSNLKELKISNPRLYKLVRSVIQSIEEKEQENENNYESDYRGEPEYDKYAND
jgi:hypothetical protein